MSSWFRAGTGCSIHGSVLSKVDPANPWRTAYGIEEVSIGKHEWKIKLIKGSAIMIGVTSNTKYIESSPWSKSDTHCYLYYGNNGYKYDKSGGSKYSQTYTTGDIITVHLDLDNNTLEFSKNSANDICLIVSILVFSI